MKTFDDKIADLYDQVIAILDKAYDDIEELEDDIKEYESMNPEAWEDIILKKDVQGAMFRVFTASSVMDDQKNKWLMRRRAKDGNL